METKTIKTIIALRRNTEQFYETVKNTFIPRKGEVVLVDTASEGLRSKVGDGVTTYANLGFTDENIRTQVSGIVVRGYYYEDEFYTDSEHTITIVGYGYKLYIDIPSSKLYTYDEANLTYTCLNPDATSSVKGVMKLYNTTGNNTDGTMTQGSITTELDKKFVVSTGEDETIIFTHNSL